ncbi:MBOAT, membrane-bound O-acyltransferase family-domain-containing protein [Chaetomium strumarium]|uniref:O-acyltransferase n=1 Tax=Chaetomium strumarium TaxID=1170767 RepID=A0AAJ0GSG4_9PEZI|nr:MBOAT, membrane-bound O-acyltransferase family-domain-containing protein [Chaetomium strumarium]
MGREAERNGAESGSGSGSGSTNGVVTGDRTPLDQLGHLSPPADSPPLFPNALREKGNAGVVETETNQGDHDGLSRSLLDAAVLSSSPAMMTRQRRKGKFTDLVFTHNFSTFDRQNPSAANSPFHGFFTLFWMAVFLFVVKIAADNWRAHGSPLGTNEIMRTMFQREVLVLLAADGAMCGLTGVSWLVQLAVREGFVEWDGVGWVLQNVWQTMFIAGVVGLTMLRDWPWTHTVYFVLHGLVMLMKQHSYAFYNGYLSSIYKQRAQLLAKLKKLERISPVSSPSRTEPPVCEINTSHLAKVPTAKGYQARRRSIPFGEIPDIDRIVAAIDSGEPLDAEQVHVFERLLKWEVDALSDELKGKSTKPGRDYPNNLTWRNHYEYVVLPTVVYELEYPRSKSISWFYVAEKAVACFGILFVMIMISQAFIYPVVMDTVRMKEEGVPLAGRFRQFPWMLLDLIFPFMMEYLLTWYLIWETILNFLAELTYFADRSFYDAWWNSVSWDQFARDWNRPVHNFLLRHVYHSSISAMRVDKHTATLITFFLSACVHELVMWCIFKKLRGYLLFLQMCQLPLVRLSRTKWLRNRPRLGNVIFWLGIFTGPSILCSLYLIL